MKISAKLTMEHVSGPEQDAETLLDWFAGTVGQQNGAKRPLHLTIGGFDPAGNEIASVYFVKLVEEAS